REWLPETATIVGAKPPRHVPRWLARLFAGEAPVMMATESRGASNAKAKRELGWTLRYPSWRQGFAELYSRPGQSTAAPPPTPPPRPWAAAGGGVGRGARPPPGRAGRRAGGRRSPADPPWPPPS